MKSSGTEATVKEPAAPSSAAATRQAGSPHGGAQRRARHIGGFDLPVAAIRVLILVALIGLWYWSVQGAWVPRMYTATPMETFQRLVEMLQQSSFWNSMRVTLMETLLGWALGSSAGLVVGLVLGRWNRVSSIADPYLTFANATPKIALAPFFILWFGVGPPSKVVLAAVIVFFIVQVPTQAAVSQVPPDLNTVATTMGATELQKFRMVVLPGIMAPVFGALRLAAVYSLLAVVMGEFIAAREGLGQALITSTNQFDMRSAFALLIVLATLAVVINLGVSAIERRVLRWRSLESSTSSASM